MPQVAVIVLAGGTALGLAAGAIGFPLGQIAVLVLFGAQIGCEIRRGERSYLMSPAFLLGAMALLAFTVIPQTLYTVLQQFDRPEPGSRFILGNTYRPEILPFIGSRAESLILVFCASVLAVHGVVKLLVGTGEEHANADRRGSDRRPQLLFAVSALFAAFFLLQTQTGILGAPVTALLNTVFGPIQSFLLIYLVYVALIRREIGLGRVVALFSANIAVMVLAHSGKIPAYIILSAVIYCAAVSRLPLWRIAKLVFFTGAVLLLCIQLVQIVRVPHASILNPNRSLLESVSGVFVAKLVWRQMETGYCFNNVIEAHAHDELIGARQVFWLEILVPRLLWPDKPDFSLGAKYAPEYCNFTSISGHSASITLLGQPVIQGGVGGMIFHGAILLLALGGATAVSLAAPGLPRVVVFALLPWWIDFDQDFALYVGNIVKFGLCMSPFILFASDRFGRRLGKMSVSTG